MASGPYASFRYLGNSASVRTAHTRNKLFNLSDEEASRVRLARDTTLFMLKAVHPRGLRAHHAIFIAIYHSRLSRSYLSSVDPQSASSPHQAAPWRTITKGPASKRHYLRNRRQRGSSLTWKRYVGRSHTGDKNRIQRRNSFEACCRTGGLTTQLSLDLGGPKCTQLQLYHRLRVRPWRRSKRPATAWRSLALHSPGPPSNRISRAQVDSFVRETHTVSWSSTICTYMYVRNGSHGLPCGRDPPPHASDEISRVDAHGCRRSIHAHAPHTTHYAQQGRGAPRCQCIC
ncbi:hypothetical protein C8Q78DRAFT_560648 [Trametes maxima]|nr:hypothetical protein C8Q78DRAFT_560648 [Trametes maxima]